MSDSEISDKEVNTSKGAIAKRPKPLTEPEIKVKYKLMVRERAAYKRKITIILNKLKESHSNRTLNPSLYNKQATKIESDLETIKQLDRDIVVFFQSVDFDLIDQQRY